MKNKFIEHAIHAIQAHLSARPESADTLEGIHQWWIRHDGQEESIAITEQALQQLEDIGFVESFSIGNRKIWRRSRQ
ncbi:hypothetical protein [Cellvibrio mixtus]|uniref:hypothetical protein n=1 Tax=Cellvibrio mixtus TaxID=39650 RepID=UPI0005880246|nr:hypothetical protein [Cellvibrio mixtus]